MVKYSGLNDLVVGVQQVILYENGEFYLELGAGGTEGTFKIEHDTVYLTYYKQPKNWPDKLLIIKKYFTTVINDGHKVPVKILREKINEVIIDTILYQDEPNGFAEIKLKIIPNGSFDLYMRALPQPMDEDSLEIVSNLSGKWIKNKNWIRLEFDNKEILLDALFDKNYAHKNEFKIIDNQNVDINTELSHLHIWDVNCKKIIK